MGHLLLCIYKQPVDVVIMGQGPNFDHDHDEFELLMSECWLSCRICWVLHALLL
jgi:hypothetical protein